MVGAKMATFALQNIHFSNGCFWRGADIGPTGIEWPILTDCVEKVPCAYFGAVCAQ
jgi:hypothetical protein